MNKVFVPQQPSRYDTGTRMWVPTINLQPAERYGKVEIALPPNANRLHIGPLAQALQEKMKDFTADDYVVAVGDPSLIAIAACIAVRKTGGLLRMLKWDRIQSTYIPVEVKI